MDEEWQKIGNGVQMKFVCDGKIVVIAPEDLKQSIVPLFCPLCEFPMTTREDGHAYRKKNCCERCELRWGTSEKFLKEDFDLITQSEEWEEYFLDRVLRSKQLIKLK